MLPYNWKPRSRRRLSIVYGLPSPQSFVYTLSMASVLEKSKKARCRVFLEAVTTLTEYMLMKHVSSELWSKEFRRILVHKDNGQSWTMGLSTKYEKGESEMEEGSLDK